MQEFPSRYASCYPVVLAQPAEDEEVCFYVCDAVMFLLWVLAGFSVTVTEETSVLVA